MGGIVCWIEGQPVAAPRARSNPQMSSFLANAVAHRHCQSVAMGRDRRIGVGVQSTISPNLRPVRFELSKPLSRADDAGQEHEYAVRGNVEQVVPTP